MHYYHRFGGGPVCDEDAKLQRKEFARRVQVSGGRVLAARGSAGGGDLLVALF